MRRRRQLRSDRIRASQNRQFKVASMLKLSFSLFLGAFIVAGSVLCSPATAQTIPEYSASSVIQLAPIGSSEKTPVISSLALDPTGRLLSAVGDDHIVRLFDVQTGRLLHRFDSHVDWVHSSVFRPDGRILATSGADGCIRLWTMESEYRPQIVGKQLPVIFSLAFSPNGRMLAAAGFDDKVWLFDSERGRLARELDAPGRDIRALSFSPDGTRLAAAGRSGLLRVWEAASGRQISDAKISARRIWALQYSPDGKRLAAAGEDRSVYLLDAATGETSAVLSERPGIVLTLCFCGPDKLATAGSSNVIRLWDLSTHNELYRLVGHTGSITTLGFETGSKTLISGGYDTTVRLWNLTNRDVEHVTRR